MADRLQELVREARDDGASEDELAGLRRGIGLAVAGSAMGVSAKAAAMAAAGSAVVGTGAGGSALLKIVATTVAATLLSTGVYMAVREAPVAVQEPLPARQSVDPRPASTAVAVPDSEDESAHGELQAPAPEPERQELVEAAPPSRRVAPRLSETALLDRARALLRRSPARALRLCQEHARRFPAGHLQQEREVLLIDALVRLGRTERARSRAAAFATRHPGSIHGPRVDAILGRGGLPR